MSVPTTEPIPSDPTAEPAADAGSAIEIITLGQDSTAAPTPAPMPAVAGEPAAIPVEDTGAAGGTVVAPIDPAVGSPAAQTTALAPPPPAILADLPAAAPAAVDHPAIPPAKSNGGVGATMLSGAAMALKVAAVATVAAYLSTAETGGPDWWLAWRPLLIPIGGILVAVLSSLLFAVFNKTYTVPDRIDPAGYGQIFDRLNVIATEKQSDFLASEMRREAVQQILRRLAAAVADPRAPGQLPPARAHA